MSGGFNVARGSVRRRRPLACLLAFLPLTEQCGSRGRGHGGLRSTTPRFSPEKQETMLNSKMVNVNLSHRNHHPNEHSLSNNFSVIFYPESENVCQSVCFQGRLISPSCRDKVRLSPCSANFLPQEGDNPP